MRYILTQAQQAILQERERRGYQVTVGLPRRSYGIAEVPMPKELEAYVAETTCTVHEHPCLWVDWAFHFHDGQFRAILQNDLSRPGMFLEQSIRLLFAELRENQKDKPGKPT